jgi:hypothetical protein
MSQGSRQEVLIRSLMEGLCLTLTKHYGGQLRQKPKLQAIEVVYEDLMGLWRIYPIELSMKETSRVQRVIEWFDAQHEGDPAWGCPEALIAFTLALGDRLYKVTQGVKHSMVGQINQKIQALYDTFDRQAAKIILMEAGGKMADQLLAREI